MFGIDLMVVGFFVTLGGKGAIDTYEGGKALVTGVMNSEKVHDAMDKVHQTVDNTLGRHKNK